MNELPDLIDVARRVAGMAGPGEEIEAFVARGRSVTAKAYDGEIESFTSAASAGIGVRVVRGERLGFAYAGTLDEAAVLDTLAEARDNAAFGEPDEHNGVARPDGVVAPVIDLWRDEVVAFPDDRRIELALELERAILAADPRIAGVRSATYSDSAGEAAVATSTGIATTGSATTCRLAATALARDGDETQTGFGVDIARRPDDLDIDRVVANAVERATRLLGATKATTQRLAVVFEPRMAAMLLNVVSDTLCGDAVLKGRSPFADRVGEVIASPRLTLVDDATDERSLAADSHDGEGLATRRTPLVGAGVLLGFLHDSYTGRRSGTGSTGSALRGVRSTPLPAAQALAVVPGPVGHDELVAGIDRGLLVQAMRGMHSGINTVSGDFSVGVEGLMIRDGSLAEPVREVTIASSLQRLLLDIEAVGAELEWLPGGDGMATLVVGDVTLSGR